MIEHDRKQFIEEFTSNLQLQVVHAVVVEQQTLLEGFDTFPYNRLYIISQSGQEKSFIQNNEKADSRLDLDAGKIVFMPENIPLKYHFTPGLKMAAFHFRIELLPGYDIFNLAPAEFKVLKCPQEYTHLIKDMKKSQTISDMILMSSKILACASLFVDFSLVEIQRILSTKEKYTPAFDCLKKPFPASHTVADLATVMGMSKETLHRHFQKDMGLSPKQFIDKNTLNCATNELTHSPLTAKEIAAKLGFTSSSYFSRFISKHTKLTPEEYRIRSTFPKAH
ncbi:MAG: helix-turn-helix transcriptional regulator [Lentisphaeria bacterium]|nr:AraC family transcriptional regulator [Lentisphaeria bacterium]NQZ68939.1 helix-turn-helix transcriptional regulator [Lentisphaeria bacterium]